jgi:hypothetical protein
MAVATGILVSPSAGHGVLGRVLTVLRLPKLDIDALAQNAVSTSRTAAFVSGSAVTFGAAVVFLLLFASVSVPSAIAWVGSLAFVMSIALSLRRHLKLAAGWLLFALAVWLVMRILPEARDYVRSLM